MQTARIINRTANADLDTTLTAVFSMGELQHAVRQLKSKKAPGPDGIHNDMLKHLGTQAKKFLLEIFNQSWTQGKVPKQWKDAEIIPIHKKGKPKYSPRSYRPISLVSCMGKLMERMVNVRLMSFLETNGHISTSQTGYRKYRGTEDQLAYLTQSIENAFQEKKKLLAVFFDMTSAFDKVWKEGLLFKLGNLGVIGKMHKWIKSLLFHRTARVKIDNTRSKQIILREGVPQGGVLSPTLFLVYINDLTKEISRHVSNSLHADDLAVWTSSEYSSVAAVRLQETINRIDQWTEKWGLNLNVTKTCSTLFTLSTKKEEVKLKLHDSFIPLVENPTFLGVTFDPRLTWNEHLVGVEGRSLKRLSLMKKLAGTTWGCNLGVLKQLYTGAVRPVMEYASTSWGTAAKSRVAALDKVQNMGLRIALGALKTTPIREMEKSTNVEPLDRRRKLKILTQAEKSKRLPTHPLHDLLDKPTKNRIKRQSLNHQCKTLSRQYADTLQTNRNPKPLVYPKWKTMEGNNADIQKKIPGIHSKEQPPAELKALASELIDEHYNSNEWTHVFTDGSAEEAVRNGGSGVFIRYPDGKTSKISIPGGRRCSNYNAEILAIKEAFTFLLDNGKANGSIVVFTDSLSALQALERDSVDLQDLINALNRVTEQARVALQWVPAHVGLLGNEMADKLAKAGSVLPQFESELTFSETKSFLRSVFQQEWITHNRGYRANLDSFRTLERKHQTTIFRLRTGHCRLNYHFHRIGLAPSPNCPCDLSLQTPEHILQSCLLFEDQRKKFWPTATGIDTKLWGTTEDLERTAQFISAINVRI